MNYKFFAAVLLAVSLLSACGGGSSGPNSYTLSGNVSNLTADGLVLSNGTDTVSVPANATSVAFPSKLSSNAPYSVSITSQPPGFTQICDLRNASGTVGNANVSSVAVSCRTASAVLTTLAGSGSAGSANGAGTAASFNGPAGVAVDVSGNIFVADTENNLIRKITSAGVVATFADSGYRAPVVPPGEVEPTFNGGSSFPIGVAVDASGNVYMADSGNVFFRFVVCPDCIAPVVCPNCVSKIVPAGVGSIGLGPLSSSPVSVAVDTSGNVYGAYSSDYSVYKITSAGVITSLAGGGNSGGAFGSANGVGAAATFNMPTGVAVDTSGNVYVADTGNNLIRKITSAGVVTTLAGSGSAGSANGAGTVASFNRPLGVAVDTSGNVYVADTGNNLIRKISPQ